MSKSYPELKNFWALPLQNFKNRFFHNFPSSQDSNSQGSSNKPQSVSNTTKSSPSVNGIIQSGLISATNSGMDYINTISLPQAPIVAPAPVWSGTPTVTVEPLEDPSAGGFVLYPNMSNTSQIQRIYSKH